VLLLLLLLLLEASHKLLDFGDGMLCCSQKQNGCDNDYSAPQASRFSLSPTTEMDGCALSQAP
jgi:hypothetical protein